MAESIVAPRRTFLDRPLLPRWQRLVVGMMSWESALYAAIILLGFLLRVWDLGFRAMHHDESLHAYYSWLMFAGKGYQYDPLMHGPLQFEIVPVFYLLFGVSELSARLFAVVCGTALIALPYALRRVLTGPGAVAASLLIALSPAMIYFSRFIRDDIYLAAFSLLLFIAIVRYIEQPRARWLYVAAAAAALAMASMEAAYLMFLIFGTFLIFEAAREHLAGGGPVLAAIRATSLDVWLSALAIFVVLTVLFYSTFFTNPYGIWDPRYPLLVHTPNGWNINPSRMDILGGLGYWHAQQYVARGGQPWFYYFLLLPLYAQVAVVFGVAGLILAAVRRSLFTTFLGWWAIMAFGLYSWAGEKMPWLLIHVELPLLLLAGYFVGVAAVSFRPTWRTATVALLTVLLAAQVHSAFALNYVDGANPTEMLIYVQTSQDVPTAAREIEHMRGWPNVTVGLDTNDLGGWPFQWYLRDDNAVTDTTSFVGPACGGQWCDVLLMLDSYGEYSSARAQILKHYVVQRYRWNWWFPEDYKVWFPAHWAAFFGGQETLSNLVGTPQDWSHVWNWFMYRRPFGTRGTRWMYFAVRRDLVPGSRYFSAGTTSPSNPKGSGHKINDRVVRALVGSPTPLAGPRDVAADPQGHLYVADTLNHRIAVFDTTGREIRAWGKAGSGAGDFSANQSPFGVAVGPDGLVYVADTWNQRIEIFTPGGRFVRQIGGGPIGSGPGQFYGPRSVAISPAGRIYVADTGNKRIQIFSRSGRYVSSFGSPGSLPGQFDEPSSVAVAPDGDVYVSDFWNGRIQEFTAAGVYLRSWPVTSWKAQTYDEPYLAVDPRSGTVLATNPSDGNVLVFTADGRELGTIGDGSLSMPIGVTAERNGVIAVTDPETNRVTIFGSLRSVAVKPAAHRVGRRGKSKR